MNIDPSLDISHPEAEAALQALRDVLHQSGDLPGGEEGEAEEHERLVEVLRAAGEASGHGLDSGVLMQLDSVASGLSDENIAGGSRKRQRTKIDPSSQGASGQGNAQLQDSVQSLMTELMDDHGGGEGSDPSAPFVPRQDYDLLKARYEALLAQSAAHGDTKAAKKRKRARPSLRKVEKSELKSGGQERKARSLKLEHLIHQMANRRLGVIYTIAPYNVAGSRDLPLPYTAAPGPEESLNGVQEYRPDFRADGGDKSVKAFLDVVIEDVKGAWDNAEPTDGQELEEEQLSKGVDTYWTSLCKRFKEQEINNRGEETKQQLGRRKQNQYRRQQSLLARRIAAFDNSPLNACRLRGLYRSLLMIDFAPRTEERPDSKRAYSAAQWDAYRKLSGSEAAYEIVDHFWLSDTARCALVLLDIAAEYSLSSSKQHGRPKRPPPTFHLPASLWDRSELPSLQRKTEDGLPDPARPGAILFRWQVSPAAQREFPEWAAGLYDDPPVPPGDTHLPSLEDVLAAPVYRSVRRRVKESRSEMDVPVLSADEVETINSHGVPDHLRRAQPLPDDDLEQIIPDPPAGQMSPGLVEGAAADLENMVNLAADPQLDPALSLPLGEEYSTFGMDKAFQAQADYQHTAALPLGALGTPTPRPEGTSLHARRQKKRGAQTGLPDGAAMPVPRHHAANGGETSKEMQADLEFLQGL